MQKYFDKSLKNHLSMRAIDRWLACIPRHIYVHIPKPGPGFSISIVPRQIYVPIPKPGPGFSTSYVVVFFVFSELRREVIVRFVDISGIVDHQCSNFLFIITYKYVKIIMLSRFIKQKSSIFLRCQILQLMNTLITTVYWRLEGRRKQIKNQMTAMWPFWQSVQVKQILMYELWDWYVILLKPCGVKLLLEGSERKVSFQNTPKLSLIYLLQSDSV
jgi:hypothetical protein